MLMRKIPRCGMFPSLYLMGDKIRIKARLNPFVLLAIVADIDCALIKAGNPSIVFDCIYNPSIKSRTLRNPDFKLFIIGPFFLLFICFCHLLIRSLN
jgi:hypothetical protein